MAEINFQERTINFQSDDFEDAGKLGLAADIITAVMLYPDNSEDITDYMLGAQLNGLLVNQYTPQECADLATTYPDFFWHLIYRRDLIEKKYADAWTQPHKGLRKYYQGLNAGRLAEILCVGANCMSGVYLSIDNNPEFLQFFNKKGEEVELKKNKRKTLEKRWNDFRHSSHLWWALNVIQLKCNSSILIDIRKGVGNFEENCKLFLEFLKTASRLRRLLVEKKTGPGAAEEKGTYQLDDPMKVWHLLSEGKLFESKPSIPYNYIISHKKSLTHQKTSFTILV